MESNDMSLIFDVKKVATMLVLICFANYSTFLHANVSAELKADIVNRLNSAFENKNAKKLTDVRREIDNIWDGTKQVNQQWMQRRDTQLIILLSALSLIEGHVDWQFDESLNVSDTLNPPLDHSIMKYSKGFALSQIKDEKRKTEIRAQLAVEKERLIVASNARYFQRRVNESYTRLLSRFTAIIVNNGNADQKVKKATLFKILNANLQQSGFSRCLKNIVNTIYQSGLKSADDVINASGGNCELINTKLESKTAEF